MILSLLLSGLVAGPLDSASLQEISHTPLAEGLMVVSLRASEAFRTESWETERLENPCRLLLRLPGMESDNIPQRYEIHDGGIEKIRLGYHPEHTPPELYVVLSFSSSETRLGRILASGDRLLLYIVEDQPPSLPTRTPAPMKTSTPTPLPSRLPSTSSTPSPSQLPTRTPIPPPPSPTKISIPPPTPLPSPTAEPVPIPTPSIPSPTALPIPIPTPTPQPTHPPEPSPTRPVPTPEPTPKPERDSPIAPPITISAGTESSLPPQIRAEMRGPRVLEIRLSPRPGRQTSVRISTDRRIPPGSFGLQHQLSPAPAEILAVLGASTEVGVPTIAESDPNIRAIEIRHREGPAGPALDYVFLLQGPEIRVMETAQQDQDLVLVFGHWEH